jgi:predicted double-glycine peptidase
MDTSRGTSEHSPLSTARFSRRLRHKRSYSHVCEVWPENGAEAVRWHRSLAHHTLWYTHADPLLEVYNGPGRKSLHLRPY